MDPTGRFQDRPGRAAGFVELAIAGRREEPDSGGLINGSGRRALRIWRSKILSSGWAAVAWGLWRKAPLFPSPLIEPEKLRADSGTRL